MITVTSDSLEKTLNKATQDLQHFTRSGRVHDYLYDMWSKGYDQVKADYDSAVTKEGEPANEHTVVIAAPKFTSDGFTLTATGADIYFLEFGTGLNMDYSNPYASKLGFYPSSYSGGPGKGFLVPPKLNHFHGAWPHNGKLHWGQNPAKGMYDAYKAMEFYARITPLGLFR